MRPIKFRGYSAKQKEWVYGSLHIFEALRQPSSPKTYIRAGQRNKDWIKVEPNSVGQATGILDEDGDAIYEGDIIEGCFKYEGLGAHGGVMPDQDCIVHGVVEWVDCGLMLKLLDCEYPLRSDFKKGILEYMPFSAFDVPECLKITRNAYDNPELVKPYQNATTL